MNVIPLSSIHLAMCPRRRPSTKMKKFMNEIATSLS